MTTTIDYPKTHVKFYYENLTTYTARDVNIFAKDICFTASNFTTFTYQRNDQFRTVQTIPLKDVLAIVITSANLKQIIKRPSKKVILHYSVGLSKEKKLILTEKHVGHTIKKSVKTVATKSLNANDKIIFNSSIDVKVDKENLKLKRKKIEVKPKALKPVVKKPKSK